MASDDHQHSLGNGSLKVSDPVDKLKCSHCSKWFSSKDQLWFHRIFIELQPFCATCNGFIDNDEDFSEHEKQHHSTLNCAKCPALLTSKSGLLLHELDEHKVISCVFCAKTLSTFDAVSEHFSRDHNVVKNTSAVWEEVTTDSFKIVHRKGKSEESCFTCSLCNSTFQDEMIHMHLQNYHEIPFRILVSYLMTTTFSIDASNIKKLIMGSGLETPKKPFDLVPLSDGQYVCPLSGCRKTSLMDDGLHFIIKHGMSFCELCSGYFRTSEGKKFHMRVKHGKTFEMSSFFMCKLCNDQTLYASLSEHASHLSRIHTDEYVDPLSNPLEYLTLLNKPLLNLSDDLEHLCCGVCSFNFGLDETNEMVMHMKIHHQLSKSNALFDQLDFLTNSEVENNIDLGRIAIFLATPEDLAKRMDANKSSKLSICIVCGKDFISSYEVQRHLYLVHFEMKNPLKANSSETESSNKTLKRKFEEESNLVTKDS